MGYINEDGSGKNAALNKREKLSLAFEHLPGMQVTRKIGQARVANRFHMTLCQLKVKYSEETRK